MPQRPTRPVQDNMNSFNRKEETASWDVWETIAEESHSLVIVNCFVFENIGKDASVSLKKLPFVRKRMWYTFIDVIHFYVRILFFFCSTVKLLPFVVNYVILEIFDLVTRFPLYLKLGCDPWWKGSLKLCFWLVPRTNIFFTRQRDRLKLISWWSASMLIHRSQVQFPL